MTTAKTNIQALWDKTANSYAFFNQEYFPSQLKLNLLYKYASADFQCLDIGIANGIYSIQFANRIKSIDGIDISDKMLEKCRFELERFSISNIFLHNQSAEDLKFEDNQFDLIFSFATLALVPDIDKAFHEIKRTLRSGGFAILDITGRNNLSRVHWAKYYRSIGHFGLQSFTLLSYKKLIQSLDFEIVENHSIGVLDQWKYIRGLHKLKFIERLTHARNAVPDFDYQVSQLFPALANHWITVLKKK